jgi:hypothetical protein
MRSDVAITCGSRDIEMTTRSTWSAQASGRGANSASKIARTRAIAASI